MSMLHSCALGLAAAQLRAVEKWNGLLSTPAPTADIHAGAAGAAKHRRGSNNCPADWQSFEIQALQAWGELLQNDFCWRGGDMEEKEENTSQGIWCSASAVQPGKATFTYWAL